MIDFGLLLSMLAVIGVPTLAQWRWPLRTADGRTFADLVTLAAMVGLVVGRLVAVGFDSPASFGRIGDLLIIRSGVEFWPGAAAAVVVLAVEARRQGIAIIERLADLAVPLGLFGYAAYEAACPFRDGCFGPVSPVGLRPPGLTTVMFPTGLLVAMLVVGVALALQRGRERGLTAELIVVGAVAGVAAVRAVASFWLPHVGDGLTRPHQTSIAVAVLAIGAAVALGLRQRAGSASPTVSS